MPPAISMSSTMDNDRVLVAPVHLLGSHTPIGDRRQHFRVGLLAFQRFLRIDHPQQHGKVWPNREKITIADIGYFLNVRALSTRR